MLLCYFIFKFKIKFTGSLNKRTSSDTVYVCSNMKISEAQNMFFNNCAVSRGGPLWEKPYKWGTTDHKNTKSCLG